MRTVPLSHFAQINPRSPKGLEDSREISFIPMAAVSESGGITLQQTRSFGEVKKGFTYFQRGDVLLAKITPCFENGKSALADNLEHQVGFGSTEFHVLRAIPGKLDSRFLYHLVRNKQLIFLGQKSMKGAAGHKRVPAEFLENFEIPEWSVDDQIRIAHLLGKVEGLIARRKQHLQQLDNLLKSVFLEMFGDPVRNEKGWTPAPLEQLGAIKRGVSKHRPRNDPKLLGGPHPLIQTGEVSNAGTYITKYTQTYSDLGFSQSKRWPAGTLCITIAANIAQTSILTFDACFPDSVVGFLAHEGEANTVYVLGLFWFFQAILEKNAPAAAQKNINLEILRTLSVPKPPIELQNKFATIVEKVEALKSRYLQSSLADLEALYGALSQQAFKGELDLSQVALPAAPVEGGSPVVAVVPAPITAPVIELPETSLLLPALQDRTQLAPLLRFWLEAYRTQSGGVAFSLERFIAAAQTRLSELHPDNDLELLASDYEIIKAWVFGGLAAGALTQAFDDDGNRIELRAATEQGLA